jgi:signal transduction histidine kinase
MRARTSVTHDREGKETGIVIIMHDVTHEREVDRMKTEFISTAAHELRTPLTSIQGFSEILMTRDDLGPEEKIRFLSYINKQSKDLTNIINDLLDISRIESGRGFSLNKTFFNTRDAITGILPYFEEHYTNHRFRLALSEEPMELYADKEKVEQVIKNLLSNAAKYSPQGGLIQVTERLKEGDYEVTVEDEGIGMTDEQIEKVFDKFYRVDASDMAVEGTGLGMTIVKYIVEAHEGEIRVESEPGKGTSVMFTIPMRSRTKEERG